MTFSHTKSEDSLEVNLLGKAGAAAIHHLQEALLRISMFSVMLEGRKTSKYPKIAIPESR